MQGDSVENVLCGRVRIVFAHPEVLVSGKKCREMFLSDVCQKHVVCVVADEAHCIVDRRVNALSNLLVTCWLLLYLSCQWAHGCFPTFQFTHCKEITMKQNTKYLKMN